MSTIFTKIVKGEIPSYKVAESDRFYAFLDINPISKGHTLVIPKSEIDYIFDMESKELSDMVAFAQNVAKGIKAAIPCKRVGVAVLGWRCLMHISTLFLSTARVTWISENPS